MFFVLTRANECALTAAQKAAQGNCPSDPTAQTCLNDIVGGTSCTAKDSPIGTIVACDSDGSNCDGLQTQTCVKGETVSFTLNLTMRANAWRYDVGAFIAPGQTQARTGYCCR